MDKDLLKALMVGLIGAIILILFIGFYPESNSLTLVGQYTVSNYSTDDGKFKVFLLGKGEKLNGSIILTNENDITEKILVVKIPY